jgi:hypothetical protein
VGGISEEYSMHGTLVVGGILLGLVASGHTAAGIDAAADNDTVLKVKYTGGSPSSTTHPAVTVEGKVLGLTAKSNNSSSAKAITGQVDGYSLPSSGTSKVGVIGAGEFGVMGKGDVGVQGEGGIIGVYGTGTTKGLSGTSTTSGGIGVWGWTSGGNNKGVYGEGTTGVHGKSTASSGIGVLGETTNNGTGVKGIGQITGVTGIGSEYGIIGEADYGYWAWGVYASSHGSSSPTSVGIQADATGGGNNYGVLADAYGGSGDNIAGIFYTGMS